MKRKKKKKKYIILFKDIINKINYRYEIIKKSDDGAIKFY